MLIAPISDLVGMKVRRWSGYDFARTVLYSEPDPRERRSIKNHLATGNDLGGNASYTSP